MAQWCRSYFKYLLWIGLMAANAFGQSTTGLSIYEDISQQWMIYDYEEKLYIPYLPGIHPPTRCLHIVLKPVSWKPAQKLILPVEKETLLFIDNNLSFHFKQQQTLIWDLDSLAVLAPQLLLTYVPFKPIVKVPPLLLGGQELAIATALNLSMTKNTQSTQADKARTEQATKPRQSSEQKNYLLAIAIACSVMLAAFASINIKYVSIQDSVQMLFQLFKYREVQEKISSSFLFGFLVIFPLVAAYLLMLMTNYSTTFILLAVTGEKSSFLITYFKIAWWLGIFFLLKYFLIKLLHNVFSHRILAEKHIAINFHFYKIFILLAFALFLAYHLSHYYRIYISPQNLYYALIWGWVAVTTLIGFVLYLSVTQRFVYLIIYLCSTEVLPLLLVIKLFLIPS